MQAFADSMLELVHLLMPEQPLGLVRQLLLRSTTDMLQGIGGTIAFVRRVRAVQLKLCSEAPADGGQAPAVRGCTAPSTCCRAEGPCCLPFPTSDHCTRYSPSRAVSCGMGSAPGAWVS